MVLCGLWVVFLCMLFVAVNLVATPYFVITSLFGKESFRTALRGNYRRVLAFFDEITESKVSA